MKIIISVICILSFSIGISNAQWRFLGPPPPVDTATILGLCIFPQSSGTICIAHACTSGHIYKTTNSGNTWLQLNGTRGWGVDVMAHGRTAGQVFAMKSG